MKYLVKFTESKLENLLLNICIFLFGINFIYKSNIILIGTFLLLFVFKKFKIDFGNKKTLTILLLFAISWFLFSNGHDKACICLPICYLIGCNICENDDNEVKKLIFLVAISLAIYTTLFFVNNAIKNGITNYDVYNQPNIWTGRPLWATNIMLYSSLFFSIFGYVLFINIDKVYKILYSIIFAINSVYAFLLGRRAALLMIMLSFVTCFIYSLLFGKKENKKIIIKISLIVISVGVLALLLIAIMYKMNIFGFKEMIKGTDLYIRFIGSGRPWLLFYDMGRHSIRRNFLDHFLKYPLGGGKIHEIINNYAHDIWLDIYDVSGFPALLLFIMYTIILVIDIVKISKNKKVSFGIKGLIISLFICVLVQCSIEPIIEACRNYIYVVCMIHGSMNLINKR